MYAELNSGLFRVPAKGGTPARITTPEQAEGETWHRWPVFLPGGRRYVYLVNGSATVMGIYLGALDSKERARLAREFWSPGYAEGPGGEGYVLFVRERTLMAQRFDANKGELAGEAFRVAEKVGVDAARGRASFSASRNGILVYESGSGGLSQLIWVDRRGKRLEAVEEPGAGPLYPSLSPNGKQVAFTLFSAGQSAAIWVRDLARRTTTRFTFHPAEEFYPVWSPDGTRIVFSSNRGGTVHLFEKSASGAGQEDLLLQTKNLKVATDWVAGGQSLLYFEVDPKTKSDLWLLALQGQRKPTPLLRTESNEGQGAVAPDGKWIAYDSDQSGRNEIYVQPYPAMGAKWQVSKDGGHGSRWRRDGKELYWLDEDGTLMAAEVSLGPAFQSRMPQPLFETGITHPFERYAVSADGKRFLVPVPLEHREENRSATVVVNWLAAAKR